MARQKFDRVEVERMIREDGLTQRQVAEKLGVTEASISKARRETRAGVVTAVGLEAGHKVLTTSLDTMGQLTKINEKANSILDGLMKEIKDGNAAQDRRKDLREIALKASGEIREQLKLQVEIMKTLYDVAQIAEFQKDVLNTIAEANKCPACGEEVFCKHCGVRVDLRSMIIEKLKKARALRAGVQLRP